MKKLIALMLCLVLATALVACGGDKKADAPKETDPVIVPSTQPTEPEITEPSNNPATIYTVTVVDEEGNPFSGIVVQLCNDTGCNPCVTDENGTATYYMAEARDDYHANVTVLPEGYEYVAADPNHYFESGSTDVTIVLKPVAQTEEAPVAE